MKTYGGMLHVLLTLALDGGGQLHAPAALSPWKETPVPTGQEDRGTQSRSERGGERKNSLPLAGIEPRSSSP